MSADNYYLVRRHPNGGYAAVMGFASDTDDNGDEIEPVVQDTDTSYPSVGEALSYAMAEYSEYGASIHPECDSPAQ